jgi:CRP-like cAMP-binding protein
MSTTRKIAKDPTRPFDAMAWLMSAGPSRRIDRVARGGMVFSQGSVADEVFYIHDGGVLLSVMSEAGKEAVVAMLRAGDFFGEGCMSDQALRTGSAKAIVPTSVLRVQKAEMTRALSEQISLSRLFVAYMLERNIRIEADLVDQLFNSSEKRLARTLLLLAHYGKDGTPQRMLPKLSQGTLAEMVGTTRSRVNYFMNKFRKAGFIEYNGGIKINDSLLRVVLRD